MWTTTLNRIEAMSPYKSDWKKLLKHLGKKRGDDAPLPILEILKCLGFWDALWSLVTMDVKEIDAKEMKIRALTIWCVKKNKQYAKDPGVMTSLDVAERYVQGLATKDDLKRRYTEAYPEYREKAFASTSYPYDYLPVFKANTALLLVHEDATYGLREIAGTKRSKGVESAKKKQFKKMIKE